MTPEQLSESLERLEIIEELRREIMAERRELAAQLGQLANEAWGIRCDMVRLPSTSTE